MKFKTDEYIRNKKVVDDLWDELLYEGKKIYSVSYDIHNVPNIIKSSGDKMLVLSFEPNGFVTDSYGYERKEVWATLTYYENNICIEEGVRRKQPELDKDFNHALGGLYYAFESLYDDEFLK